MKCFVLGCKNDFHGYKYSNEPTVKFSVHRFPFNWKRRLAWLEAIARAENRQLDIDGINFAVVRVCSNHFPDSDFVTVHNRTRLSNTAVPTLFGDDVSTRRRPQEAATESYDVKIRQSHKKAQSNTKKLIQGVLGCVQSQNREDNKPSKNNTLFRLEKFPHVCRLCLVAPKTDTELMIPLDAPDHLLDGLSVSQFIAEILPAEATLEQSLQNFLPNKICLPCLELLKFFAKFRSKITIVHLLMNSLVEMKQFKTSLPIVNLFKNKSDLLKAVIKDLNLCRRSKYSARDLLKEFPRYKLASFEGFDAETVVTRKPNDNKDYFPEAEKIPATEEVIPKQENKNFLPDFAQELANFKVEPDMIFAEECTVEELNELTKVKPDLVVSDSSDDYPIPKKKKPPAKAKYGGKKLDQPLQCPKCRYSTHYPRNFETHQEVHKKREAREYACKEPGCTEVFQTRLEYKRHGPTVHKAYICDHCGLRTSSKAALKDHLARHLQKLEYSCHYCKRGHNTKTDLRNHIRYAHLSRVAYQCKVCQLSFSRKYALDEHMAIHGDSYDFPCTLCDKKFKLRQYLKNHISTVHERHRLPCGYCSANYESKYKLNNHIESVHGIQTRFVCDVCVITYNSQDKLDVHLARHNQPHEMECGRCLTAFTSKDLLDSHPCITYREDYVCCDRDHRYHYIYNKHMLMKHGIKTNARVKPTPGLLMGQMRAQRKRIETCPKCEQIFATRTLKKQHMEICTFTENEGQQGNGNAEASEEAMAVEALEEFADNFE